MGFSQEDDLEDKIEEGFAAIKGKHVEIENLLGSPYF